ncbi:MAG: DUF1232 domain-containing protein [Leptolyngbya sp. SIO1D8]|nr:DUF1232 domain-containing protein [Leptolyngbya sp. SIO1D8]
MKRLLGEPIFKWFTNLIRNSKYRWLVILGSLIYLISPLDISPDFLPVIGWIDDGLLATIVVTELTQLMLEKRRQQTSGAPESTAEPQTDAVIDVESVTVG